MGAQLHKTILSDNLYISQGRHNRGTPLGRKGRRDREKTLRQICANLIGTSWHLVTQHPTSAIVSLTKTRVNKLHLCFGSRGSEVKILSPRPFKAMGYGLDRGPFLVVGVGNVPYANPS